MVNVHLNRKILPRLGVLWGRNVELQRLAELEVRRLGGDLPEGQPLDKIFSGIKNVNLSKFAAAADEAMAILNGWQKTA